MQRKTEISLSTLEKQRGEPGKYRMYCRAAVEKGILKVYLFAVTDIEENINFQGTVCLSAEKRDGL